MSASVSCSFSFFSNHLRRKSWTRCQSSKPLGSSNFDRQQVIAEMIRRMSMTWILATCHNGRTTNGYKWQNLRMRKKPSKITRASWWKTEFREICHGIGMILADLRQVAKHQKRSSRDMLPDLLSRAHWEVFNVISLTTYNFYFRPKSFGWFLFSSVK